MRTSSQIFYIEEPVHEELDASQGEEEFPVCEEKAHLRLQLINKCCLGTAARRPQYRQIFLRTGVLRKLSCSLVVHSNSSVLFALVKCNDCVLPYSHTYRTVGMQADVFIEVGSRWH